MPNLHRISESDLRSMARDATSMHLQGGTPLNDAVVKVASDFPHPLTSEHVRRVCEMTYHDTFERSFRQGGSSGRVVNFDPPDAEKVASAIRAQKIRSYQDKLASANAEGAGHDKTASSPVEMPFIPPPRNAFSLAMAVDEDNEVGKLEARDILKTAQRDVKDAIQCLETELGTIKHAEMNAYRDLGGQVRQTVLDGMPPEMVLETCATFMKEGQVDDAIAEDIITALAVDMLNAGLDLSEKRASLDGFRINPRHPLNGQVMKVASLRREKFSREIALSDLRNDGAKVTQELQRAIYQ
jgi:hypothetical protein